MTPLNDRVLQSSLVFFMFRAFSFVVFSIFKFFNNWFVRKRTLPPIRDPLLLQSARSLARKIRNREVTSEDIVLSVIERIREVNGFLNCAVVISSDMAIVEARKIDVSIRQGEAPDEVACPLLGVPFTCKDSISVEGMQCTAGIPYRKSLVMDKDAEVVRRLRKAGAVCVALSNTSEVCMYWETNNTLFGRSRNPYDCRRIVGGSSGGEGGLVGAGASVLGIGSDIGGSLRMPAFFNGIFTHKASPGLVSNEGTYPPVSGYRNVMLAVGPLCRYAEDLSFVLNVLRATKPNLDLNKEVDLKNLRIYYWDNLPISLLSPVAVEVKQALNIALKHFENKYNICPTKLDFPELQLCIPIWLNDMKGDDGEYPSFRSEMRNRNGEIRVLNELILWLLRKSRHTFPALLLAATENLYSSSLSANRGGLIKIRERLRNQLNEILEGDAILLCPPHPTVAPFHYQTIMTPFNYIYTAIFNSLRLPVTQCPVGLSQDGVPVGVQIVAAELKDYLTLAVAKELETAFGGWAEPIA